MLKTIVGMFSDPADARRAVASLEESGFPADAVSVAMRERYESALLGGGSLLALVAGNQASTAPMDYGQVSRDSLYPTSEEYDASRFGPMVAAGPLAQGMGGAALGQSAGGLTGALSNTGVPNDVARTLITRVRAGEQTLVAISLESTEAERVQGLFVQNGAAEVYVTKFKARTGGDGGQSVLDAQMGF